MTTYKILFAGLALICACAAADTVSPLACNLKAFQPQERAEWRKRLEQVMGAVTAKRPMTDGYTFQIDSRKAGFREVATWIELERKCCPFFIFELGMQGENGAVWLNLRGREGVKQFIAADFKILFDRLP
jgi:hypothetical protein